MNKKTEALLQTFCNEQFGKRGIKLEDGTTKYYCLLTVIERGMSK